MKVNYKELYFQEKILAERDGKRYSFSVQLKDLSGRIDCQIGDFGNNIWFRTRKGLLGLKYKSVGNLKRCVKQLLKRNGFENMRWIKSDH